MPCLLLVLRMPRSALEEYLDYFDPPSKRWYWYLQTGIYTVISLYMAHRLMLLAIYTRHKFSHLAAIMNPKKRKRSPRKIVKEYLLPRQGSLKIVPDKQ